MTIPDHEHHVRLALFHAEVDAAYGVRDGVGVSLRLPYDVKDQHVRYTTLDGQPFIPPYGDIHHRTETLYGKSDADLLLLWAPATPGASRWRFGFGTTLPLGHTVPDPVRLGLEGKTHEHLQFGSGVYAPEAEIAWSRPFRTAIASVLLQATVPLTTNEHGFRAPKNFRWTAGPSFAAGRGTIGLSAAGQYQTIGRWHGALDEGTGFSNGGLRLQLAYPLLGTTVTSSVYRELYSHGLNASEDETFSQGTTFALTISRAF
ncbi:MAG TPA: hypothetical protein VGJ81_02890 [Thermoanaerobaculia bacterium]|jgi:hypothetical protein